MLKNISPYAVSNAATAANFHMGPVSTQKCLPEVKCLPKLPVPSLEQTFYKYMRSVKPVVSEEDYKKHCETMVKFVSEGGEGRKLQALLQKRHDKLDNWLEEWWLNTAYLGFRHPVTIYSSPALTLPRQTFCDKQDQVNYAAKLIISAFNYMAQIDR